MVTRILNCSTEMSSVTDKSVSTIDDTNEMQFLNIRENELVHQRFLIVHGQVSSVTGNDDKIVVNHPTLPAIEFPAVDGYFKAVVGLEAGANELEFEYMQRNTCICKGSLTVKMEPFTDKPALRLAVIIGKDSPKTFDAPPDSRGPGKNDLDAAIRKLRCSAYLWQAFMAEQMRREGFGFRTFNLEENYEKDTMFSDDKQRMTAKVHVVRSTRTVAEIRAESYAQQWKPLVGEKHKPLGQMELAQEALLKTGWFNDHNVVCLILDSQWDKKRGIVVGHGAVGSQSRNRRLAVYGSYTTHAWPGNMHEVPARFLDTGEIDKKYVYNNEKQSSKLWQLTNIGMGEHLHMCAVTMGPTNSPSGIASRGYQNLNRAFMAREPGWEGPVRQEDEAGAHWHRTDAVRLRHHPFMRLPSDQLPSVVEKTETGFEVLAVDDGLLMCNESGLAMIEVKVNGALRGYIEYTAENFDCRKSGEIFATKEETIAVHPTQVVLDLDRLRKLAGEWQTTDSIGLVLTTGQCVWNRFNIRELVSILERQTDHASKKVFMSSQLWWDRPQDTNVYFTLLSAQDCDSASSVSKLKSIEIFMGWRVNGIIFHMDNGKTQRIGKCNSDEHHLLVLKPDDDLDRIIVNFGSLIEGIEVVTTKGRTTGWLGTSNGKRHVLKPPSGYAWAGVSGYYNEWLKSLTMLYSKSD
ncbi:hypothetical protein H4R20_000138 [Coemansia guatemalensis]|uniref:Jacalin-type lectin domain-containing protein n=1 Tax=Coemansia guatemalensis TaxID=2761395 RepID=A0A9W8HZS0_9FUNG|nr:hypothetical protein H4R20_000138 [Coemansia guatemalensis]